MLSGPLQQRTRNLEWGMKRKGNRKVRTNQETRKKSKKPGESWNSERGVRNIEIGNENSENHSSWIPAFLIRLSQFLTFIFCLASGSGVAIWIGWDRRNIVAFRF